MTKFRRCLDSKHVVTDSRHASCSCPSVWIHNADRYEDLTQTFINITMWQPSSFIKYMFIVFL